MVHGKGKRRGGFAALAAAAVASTGIGAPAAHAQAAPGALAAPGRIPIDRTADALVVLLHGFGSNGTDFEGLADRIVAASPRTAVLHPNAPTPEPTGTARPGYTWFEFAGRNAASSREAARDHVRALIDEAAAALSLPDDAPIVVAGFSQGGGVAVHVGTCAPGDVALAVAMGGLVESACPNPADAATPVVLVHNDGDPRIPLDWARRSEAMLRENGFAPRLEVFQGDQHWLVPAAMARVEALILDALEEDAG